MSLDRRRLALFLAGTRCSLSTSALQQIFRRRTTHKLLLRPSKRLVLRDNRYTRSDPCCLETCLYRMRCTPSTALRAPPHQQRTVRKQSILRPPRSCRPSNRRNSLVPSLLEPFLGRSRYKRWTSRLGRRCQPHTECTKSPWRSKLWIRFGSPRTSLAQCRLGLFPVDSRYRPLNSCRVPHVLRHTKSTLPLQSSMHTNRSHNRRKRLALSHSGPFRVRMWCNLLMMYSKMMSPMGNRRNLELRGCLKISRLDTSRKHLGR